MDKETVLENLEWMISHYEDRVDEVFYLREEYRDGGRPRRVLGYEIEIREQPPAEEEVDELSATPLDPVRVGVRFAAFTRLDPLRKRQRFVRLSGASVLARLYRIQDLVENGRLQPPGEYAGFQHAALGVPGYLRFRVDELETGTSLA